MEKVKDISLSGIPVFKKKVLGGGNKEVKESINSKIEEAPAQREEYFKVLEELNDSMGESEGLENNNQSNETTQEVITEEIAAVEQDKVMITETVATDLPEILEEDVVVINSEEVEIINRHETEIEKDPFAYSGPKVKTGDVALELGISDQMVRNYCESFSELLEVERTPSGQRLFSKQDIEQLRAIIEFKNKHNYTNEQTVRAYKANTFFHADPDFAGNLMEAKLAELAALIADEVAQRNSIMIEDKMHISNEELAKRLEDFQEKQNTTNAAYQKIIDEKNEQIMDLMKKNEEKDETIRKIVEEGNENLISTMREMLQEKDKKRGWFPWSK